MNLADIRKKAQQAQKTREGETASFPVPVEPRPLPERAPRVIEELVEQELAAPQPGWAGSPASWPEPEPAPEPAPVARVQTAQVQPAQAPRPQAAPVAGAQAPIPGPAAASAAAVCAALEAAGAAGGIDPDLGPGFFPIGAEPAGAVPAVITFPAIPGAPSAPEPEEPFDPLSVILRGRELAALEDVVSEVAVEETASLELLCFRVASEEYAIDIMDIKEIIRPREVTEVPRVPSFVKGILSLRGIIIPVFDMRLRLGLPVGAGGERERVVVVKRENGFCGILVDEVVQVVRIPHQGIEPPPVVLEGIDREFVEGIGRVSGRILILLDMAKVLDVALG